MNQKKGVTQAELPALLEQARRATMAERQPGVSGQESKVQILWRLLDAHYSVNRLYTGAGVIMTEHGDIGAREHMFKHDVPSLEGDTPDPSKHALVGNGREGEGNHIVIELGILTQEDFDAVYGAQPGAASGTKKTSPGEPR